MGEIIKKRIIIMTGEEDKGHRLRVKQEATARQIGAQATENAQRAMRERDAAAAAARNNTQPPVYEQEIRRQFDTDTDSRHDLQMPPQQDQGPKPDA